MYLFIYSSYTKLGLQCSHPWNTVMHIDPCEKVCDGRDGADSSGFQFSSVAEVCPTLCHPMDNSTPGLPVHHQLPESTQTQVHWIGDAIQPSHPLSSPSLPAVNLSPASGSFQMSQFFASGGWSIGVSASASVLPMNIQDWFPLRWTGWIVIY